MKKYIHTNDDITKIQIVVEVEFLNTSESVAASYSSERFKNSELPPAEKDALMNSQVFADYAAFVETIEDLITDYFGLNIYYKNDNAIYNSFYFGVLAVDDNENYILDCEAVIRISTHYQHKTPASEEAKAKQKAKLKEVTNGARLQPVRKNILINDKSFSNYDDAYEFIFPIIERVATVLNRTK